MIDPSRILKDYILAPAHVGFVVENIDFAIEQACRLYGVSSDAVRYEPAPGVKAPTRFAFFSVGGLEFEYIEPCDEYFRELLLASPSGGGGINHVAWKVRDIESAVKLAASHGVIPGYVTPDGVITIGSKRMVYLDPASTGGLLVELIEELDADIE